MAKNNTASTFEKEVKTLVHTSVDDCRIGLNCMISNSDPVKVLQLVTGAFELMKTERTGDKTRRKVLAAGARKALKKLEEIPEVHHD